MVRTMLRTWTDFVLNVCFALFTEYIEDICPYATFQLNKQTYSESSYSGNVYSGPYHSVRGSFVYHDVKPDGYQVVCKQTNSLTYKSPFVCVVWLVTHVKRILFPIAQSKEPEYTKVRRKGNRLRDPHSESQGTAADTWHTHGTTIPLFVLENLIASSSHPSLTHSPTHSHIRTILHTTVTRSHTPHEHDPHAIRKPPTSA